MTNKLIFCFIDTLNLDAGTVGIILVQVCNILGTSNVTNVMQTQCLLIQLNNFLDIFQWNVRLSCEVENTVFNLTINLLS